jgi:hypothetical protein
MSDNPLQPSASLLCKIGSIVGHIEEAMTVSGHEFDLLALKALLADTEVQRWLGAMGAMAMIPLKRDATRGC